jgi:hypothetical protein
MEDKKPYDEHLLDRENTNKTSLMKHSKSDGRINEDKSKQNHKSPMVYAHLVDDVIGRPMNSTELKEYKANRRRSLNQYIEQNLGKE